MGCVSGKIRLTLSEKDSLDFEKNNDTDKWIITFNQYSKLNLHQNDKLYILTQAQKYLSSSTNKIL